MSLSQPASTTAVTQPLAEPRCPLCGGPNGCAAAASGSFDGPCWCSEAAFPPALLAAVPEAARGRACICRRCAEQHAQQTRQAQQTQPLPQGPVGA